jgi:hypothetical protein
LDASTTVKRWLLAWIALPAVAAADPWQARWEDFLATAELSAVMANYGVLDALGRESDLDRGCAQYAEALRAARDAMPFSPALQLASLRCAPGERAQSEARALLDAQRAFLLRDGRGANALQPVPLAAEVDARALIDGAGWTYLYGRYKVGATSGSLPFVVIYRDQSGIERQLHIDFLRVWQALDRQQPEARFPAYLTALAAQYLRSTADRNPATEMAQITTRVGEGKLEIGDASIALERLALDGHAPAAFELLPICIVAVDSVCLTSARALLKPLAERGLAEAHLVLALDHDQAGESRAAVKRIDQAARLLGRTEADLAYVQLAFSIGPRGRTVLAERRLKAAARHSGDAAFLLAQQRLPPSERAVRRAAELGSPAAAAQLALLAWRERDARTARHWMRIAGRAGDPAGLALLALVTEIGSDRAAPDPERAHVYFVRAAQAGNAGAMRRLGRAYERGELGRNKDLAEAEGWYLSASIRGNQTAALALANLYLQSHPSLRGDREDGMRIIEELAKAGHVAAQLRLASVLLPRGGADSERALALLIDLDGENIAAASFRLGQIAEFGQAGQSVDYPRALAYYRRAAAAGHAAGRDFLARALYAGRGTERDRRAALRWWSDAAAAGWAPAANALAWVQCTSADPAVRNPLAGARRISDLVSKDRQANYRDTLAACLAASGQMAEAIEVQREVLASAAAEPQVTDGQRAAFAERLKSYEAGQRWTED